MYHDHMDALVMIDAGMAIRKCAAKGRNHPFSVKMMDGEIGYAFDIAAGAGYSDPFLVIVFDEPPTPALRFKPHINRSRLVSEYTHIGYDISDPAERIPVQEWKQSLYRKYKVLSYPGAEARDLIASVLGYMKPFGDDAPDIIIRTDDPSLLQCVDDRRRIMISGGFHGGDDPHLCDCDSVTGYIGVPPSKTRMLESVCGDPMDGYDGIRECYSSRMGRDIVTHSDSIRDIASQFPDERTRIVRNWRLSGVGDEYMDVAASSRARGTMALIMGPEF